MGFYQQSIKSPEGTIMSETARILLLLTVRAVWLKSFLTRKKQAQVQRKHRPSTVTNFQSSKSARVLNYATQKRISFQVSCKFLSFALSAQKPVEQFQKSQLLSHLNQTHCSEIFAKSCFRTQFALLNQLVFAKFYLCRTFVRCLFKTYPYG